jgi:hypothetical protein
MPTLLNVFPPVPFRVVAVSNAPDNFGQWGHVIMSKKGMAFEVSRQRGEWMGTSWARGTEIEVARRADGSFDWHLSGVELTPRSLPEPSKAVLAAIWKD